MTAGTGFPLSPQQRRAWRLAETLDSTVGALVLGARTDLPSLAGRPTRDGAAAWSRVVERHPVLASRFVRLPGLHLPVQVAAPASPPSALCLDLSSSGAQERAARRATVARDLAASLCPAEGRVAQAAVVTLDPQRHELWIVVSALAGDDFTLDFVAAAVDAVLDGREPEVEPVAYADVAQWLNAYGDEEHAGLAREHWLRRLDGPLPRAPLPFALRGVPPERFRPRERRVTLDPSLEGELRSLAATAGVEAWIPALAAWQAVTAALSAGAAAPLGLACDGRQYEELADAPGPLTRFVPLAAYRAGSVDPDLAALATEVDEAQEWQEGFLWEDLAAGDEPPPFFPVGFRRRAEASSGPRRRDAWGGFDRCHLELVWEEVETGSSARLRYDGARFAEADAEHLLDRLLHRLRSAVSSRSQAPAVMARNHVGGRDGDPSAAPDPGFGRAEEGRADQLFLRWVECRPREAALVADGRSWTWAELETWSGGGAAVLRRRGVGPEKVVALLLPRGAEAVAAVLAVLRAGGAYLPLDPALPSARLLEMVRDSGARWLLTAGGATAPGWAHEVPDLDVLGMERLEEAVGSGASESLAAGPADPANLAYLIYTSGSSGRPKGVAVEHRQITAYVAALLDRLQAPAGTSFVLASTLAADLGHTALFGALLGGGVLHVLSEEEARGGQALARRAATASWDLVKITPGHLRALLDSVEAEAEATLLPRHWLVLGGEACPWDLVERVAARAPTCRVVNHYGPTETTVGVLAGEVGEPGPLHAPVGPALGTPLGHARVRLVGPDGLLADRWEVGEILAAGACVARGYHGRPGATAERFVPDPAASHPGQRAYRTGDRGRWLPAGRVEFLGRLDQQVKIRGFRVEPGEVAARLAEHPAVREAVVVARPGPGGEPHLVAYAATTSADEDGLRHFVEERLPPYLVPGRVVVLEKLPRTANGKVDRGALPEPPPRRAEGRPPESAAERRIADLWEGLLGARPKAVEDDFFRLGGHSLLAIQLRAQLRDAFGVELPLERLFESPSVEGLAEAVAAARCADEDPLERQPRDRPLPLSFAQERLWVLHRLHPDSTAYHIFVPVALRGPLRVVDLLRALGHLVARHETLRTGLREVDGRGAQVIHPAVRWRPAVVDLGALPEARRGAERTRLGRLQAAVPFDLATPPLLRAWLVEEDRRRHALLLTLHHAMGDGWSLSILLREALALYESGDGTSVPDLPELPAQYADFAAWQRQRFTADVLEGELAYWRERLAGAPPVLDLPFDRPRGEEQSDRGGAVHRVVPASLAEAVEARREVSGTTLFVALAAAMNLLLHWATGRVDVVFGTDVANRERTETQSMVGFFVNQLVLRTDLSGDPDLATLLERTRQAALGAYAHQNLPFERLVAALNPQRSLGRFPLFQVKLLVQHAPPVPPRQGELAVERLPVEQRTSQLDLLINVLDTGEGYWLAAEYSADLFDAETVSWLLQQLETALGLLAREPDLLLPAAVERLRSAAEERRREREEAQESATRGLLRSLRTTRRAPGLGSARERGD